MKSDLLYAVVDSSELLVKMANIVLVILPVRLIGQDAQGVKCGVAVPPQLEALDGADALDLAIAIRAAVQVCPAHVSVVYTH